MIAYPGMKLHATSFASALRPDDEVVLPDGRWRIVAVEPRRSPTGRHGVAVMFEGGARQWWASDRFVEVVR
jgi:hypothetical protein